MRMKCLWVGVVAAGCAAGAWGQGVGAGAVREFPAYKLIEGAIDSDGFPTSGAKLCVVEAPAPCFQMPSNLGYSKSGVVYDYGLEPKAERLPMKGGGSLVLFSATFSGGGSGSLDSLALLRYEGARKFSNLLPFVGLSNQSDRATWSIAEISDYPILVTADFDWMNGETHFAKHFYEVSVYRFDPRLQRYVRVLKYRTSKKYASLDEADEVRVIQPERQEIMRRLKAAAK